MTSRGLIPVAMAAILAVTAAGCSGSSASSAAAPGNSAGNPGAGNVSGSGGATADGSADVGAPSGAGPGGSSGVDGGATMGGSSDASIADGAADFPATCSLTLTPLSEKKFDPFERSPTPFRVRATVAPKMDMDQWFWNVANPDGSVLHPPMVNGDPAVVEFPIEVVGQYHITFGITNRPLCAPQTYTLTIIEPRPAAFVFRIFPPASLPVPVQEFSRTPVQLSSALALDSQIQQINVFTYDGSSHELPSYLQITSPTRALVIEGNTRRGLVLVPLLDGLYDMLLIPDGQSYAPKLISGPPSVLSDNHIILDPGIAVTGAAQRSDGSPVIGARLVMHERARPSTVGTTDGTGTFSLWTRDGNLSVDVAAPANSGLPDAHVDATAGVVLGPNATGLTLTMRWAMTDAGALNLTVHGTDGTTVAAGAPIYIESTGSTAAAGQLTVHWPDGGVDLILPATRSLRANAISDSKGAFSFASLPVGTYRVTVTPPVSAGADAAVTTTTINVTAAGSTRDVRLTRKVSLSGTLQAATGSTRGVRITAIDTGSDIVTSAASTVVGEGGQYALSVDPGRSYKLWAVPASGQLLGRATLGTMTAQATDQTLPVFTLPAGISVSGKISAPSPVADALVQVYCPPLSTTCADATMPLAETVTDITGSFTVILPNFGDGSGKI